MSGPPQEKTLEDVVLPTEVEGRGGGDDAGGVATRGSGEPVRGQTRIGEILRRLLRASGGRAEGSYSTGSGITRGTPLRVRASIRTPTNCRMARSSAISSSMSPGTCAVSLSFVRPEQHVPAKGVDAQTEKNLGSLFDLSASAIGAGRIPRVVTVVPTVSDFEEASVSPELVLVDPALRAHLAMRESVSPEIVEPPHAAAPIGVPAAVVVVPEVSDAESSVSPEPVLVDPALRAQRAMHVPGRSAPRRLLVGTVVAVALFAAASFGVFGGFLSGHRAAPRDAAAPTPPAPPKATAATVPKAAIAAVSTPRAISTEATAATAPKAANPAASTPRPISRTRTAAAAPQAGVGAAPSSPWLGWPAVAKASAYAVEITRNGESIYSATTSAPHIRVPGRWRRDRRTMTLAPGTYRWSVWPIVRVGTTTRKFPPTVVASKLEITR